MKGINQKIPHYSVGNNYDQKALAHGINPSPVHAEHVAKAFAFTKGQKQDHQNQSANYIPGTGSPWLAMKGK